MRAAVLENNKFVIKDVEKPSLEQYKTGAVVKVIGCGLCGSDMVKIYSGLAKDGDILGHEVVGEIVELNTNTSFQIGDKIALGHHVPCFNCHYCWNGSYSMCRHFKSTNIRPGGFAEYIYVSEEHLNNTVFNVNLNLSDIDASFLEPLGCCIRAVQRAELKLNSKSLVIGLGSVGILMGGAVNAFGHDVFGCDIKPERVDLSKNYGFENSFLFKDEKQTFAEMKKYAPLGFDTVFLTAGATSSLSLAMKTVRDGGKIVVFSSIKDNFGFLNNYIYYREITIMGSYSPSPMDLEDSMKFIEQGKVKVSGLSSVYSLENLNQAVEDTRTNKIMKAFIKI